jgi:hypothetical protein
MEWKKGDFAKDVRALRKLLGDNNWAALREAMWNMQFAMKAAASEIDMQWMDERSPETPVENGFRRLPAGDVDGHYEVQSKTRKVNALSVRGLVDEAKKNLVEAFDAAFKLKNDEDWRTDFDVHRYRLLGAVEATLHEK